MAGAVSNLSITDAARSLREGGLVVIPTETVYGVAASAASGAALERLRSLRIAPPSPAGAHPGTWHAESAARAIAAFGVVSPLQLRIFDRLIPGPLRLLIEKPAEDAARLIQRLGVVPGAFDDAGVFALRVPSHPAARRVLEEAGVPVVVERATNFGLGDGRAIDDSARRRAAELGIGVFDAAPAPAGVSSTTIRLLPSGGYRVVSEGVLDEATVRSRIERVVAFVCTGNTCRSPMAGAIARHLVGNRPALAAGRAPVPVRVVTAGVAAGNGAPMTREAQDALRGLGVDPGQHRSRSLTQELARSAEAIFVMTASHAQAVLAIAPDMRDRTFMVDPGGRSVEDPIGGAPEVYRDVAGFLLGAVRARLEELAILSPER